MGAVLLARMLAAALLTLLTLAASSALLSVRVLRMSPALAVRFAAAALLALLALTFPLRLSLRLPVLLLLRRIAAATALTAALLPAATAGAASAVGIARPVLGALGAWGAVGRAAVWSLRPLGLAMALAALLGSRRAGAGLLGALHRSEGELVGGACGTFLSGQKEPPDAEEGHAGREGAALPHGSSHQVREGPARELPAGDECPRPGGPGG